jgi:hypothetical protein
MQQEPEHLVPGGIAVDRGTGLLDHAGVVAAQHHRELVLDHASEDAAGDEGVDRVDRGGPDADQQLVVADLGGRQVLAQAGWGVEAVQGEGAHRSWSLPGGGCRPTLCAGCAAPTPPITSAPASSSCWADHR